MTRVLDEIDRRIAQLRQAQPVKVPLLALGISERVGSNWLSDTLRPVMTQHNEPLRQHIAAAHPLSALNPNPADVADSDLDGLGAHWLASFVVSKYAPRRHLVKETNLFFATPTLLRLFPQSPVAVLSRSPLGVASSFLRGGLWVRWRYAERYTQLAEAAKRVQGGRWASLLPEDTPTALAGLARLAVLGALLLAENLTGRDHVHLGYERRVLDYAGALSALRTLVPDVDPAPVPVDAESPKPYNDTYTTTSTRNELVAYLDAGQAAAVWAETGRRLRQAGDLAAPPTVAAATAWLAGDHHYRLAGPPAARPGRDAPSPPRPRRLPITAEYVPASGCQWRNLLVTNAEFARLLDRLQAAGLPNTHTGTHLLLTVMPHGRGGRVHFDPDRRCWRVSTAYEHHPLYWLTWIGAATYAAWSGARLPTRAELDAVTAHTEPTNVAYSVGDVVPVVEPGRDPSKIHHLVGNLQVWCADGPVGNDTRPVERWLHGAAWNTPGSREEVIRPRSRHLLGSSRGVGVRLVRDPHRPLRPVPAADLADRLRRWREALGNRSRSLHELDRLVVDALQADVGLGTHIGPGTGKTGPA
jgi:hypothetical protein